MFNIQCSTQHQFFSLLVSLWKFVIHLLIIVFKKNKAIFCLSVCTPNAVLHQYSYLCMIKNWKERKENNLETIFLSNNFIASEQFAVAKADWWKRIYRWKNMSRIYLLSTVCEEGRMRKGLLLVVYVLLVVVLWSSSFLWAWWSPSYHQYLKCI